MSMEMPPHRQHPKSQIQPRQRNQTLIWPQQLIWPQRLRSLLRKPPLWVVATLLLTILSATTIFTEASSAQFARALNPTGNPIGGYVGYSRIVNPSQAQFRVNTRQELLSALQQARSGDIVYVEDNAVIDLTGAITCPTDRSFASIKIPGGVTLASGRGRLRADGSIVEGALLYTNDLCVGSNQGAGHAALFETAGENVRITGLRFKGPAPGIGLHNYTETGNIAGLRISHGGAEVDNNEVFGFDMRGIWLQNYQNASAHHNYVHHCRREGYGYGIQFSDGAPSSAWPVYGYAEANLLNGNRHTSDGAGGPNSFEMRHNIILPKQHFINTVRHGAGGTENSGGHNTFAHHNLYFQSKNMHVSLKAPATTDGEVRVYNNWFSASNLGSACTISRTPCDQVSHPRIFFYDNYFSDEGRRLPAARIEASQTSGYAPLTVTFDASASSDPDAHAITWHEWQFGDGPEPYGERQRSSRANPRVSHTFLEPGLYGVDVMAFNAYGVPGMKHAEIEVKPPQGGYVLSAWLTDLYYGTQHAGFYKKQILVDEAVVWEDDVAGDEGWQHVAIDLTSRLQGKTSTVIRFRLYVARDITDPLGTLPEMAMYVDDVHLFGGNVNNGSLETGTVGNWREAKPSASSPFGFGIDAEEPRSGVYSIRMSTGYGTPIAAGEYQSVYQSVPLGSPLPPASSSNQPPNVSLTSPQDGSAFSAPATIELQASASDVDVSVAKVEFFQGTTKLGEDSSAPYGFTWASVAQGSYSLTARAIDDKGASTTSTAVNITVQGTASSPGLVAHWKLDEGSGSAASDASGNGHTGQLLGGPSWTAGQISGALQFDGTNDYVEVSDAPGLNLTNALTIMGWFKHSSDGEDNASGVEKHHAYRLLVKQSKAAASHWIFDFWDSQDNYHRLTTSNTLSNDEWHHIAATFDGSEVKIYVDGKLDNSERFSGKIRTGSGAFEIGRRGGMHYYAGLIDEVQLYDRALSQAQIQQIIYGGSGAASAAASTAHNADGTRLQLQQQEQELPGSYSLEQNYPNPFNPHTLIKYRLPELAHVKLEVYDLLGRRVALLVDALKEAGSHEVVFEAASLASGVYLYRIEAGPHKAARRMLLLE